MAVRERRLTEGRRELALSAAGVIELAVLRGVSRGLRRSFGEDEWRQEAWLAVCKAARDIDPESHPGVPFLAFARNGIRLHFMGETRKYATRLAVWREMPADPHRAGAAGDFRPDDAHPEDHRGPAVPAVLSAWCSDDYRAQRSVLNWRERVILYLRFVEGWYQWEIAECLGITHARVGQLEEVAVRRLAAARNRAREMGR